MNLSRRGHDRIRRNIDLQVRARARVLGNKGFAAKTAAAVERLACAKRTSVERDGATQKKGPRSGVEGRGGRPIASLCQAAVS